MSSTMRILTLCALSAGVSAGAEAADIRSRDGSKTPTHEQIVRFTYAKLARLQRADVGRKLRPRAPAPRREELIEFKIGEMKTGPVAEILKRPLGELVTKPDGEIILSGRGRENFSDGRPPRAYYLAQWAKGQRSFNEDWNTPVETVFAMFPQRFAGVTDYASYAVTVRLQGKERTYRALALFKGASPDPDFDDLIVSLGDSLNHAYAEDARPGPFWEAMTRNGATGVEGLRNVLTSGRDIVPLLWCDEFQCCDDETSLCCDLSDECGWDSCEPGAECGGGGGGGGGQCNTENRGAYVDRYGHDGGNHLWGEHRANSTLQGVCKEDNYCRRSCVVDKWLTTDDTGLPSGACHKFGTNQADETGVGACAATNGAAVQECFLCQCNVSVSVIIGSVEAPGAFWTYAHTHRHNCQGW